MHRNDKSRFLLYIEPKKEEKLKDPINDKLTELMEIALTQSQRGSSNYSNINGKETFKENDGWRGSHGTDCGEISDSHDFLLQNGLITNSLAVFYIKYYRNSIHENDWNKLKMLGDYYDVDIQLPETFPDSPASTIPRSHEQMMNDFQNTLIEELSKSIDKEIIKKIMEEANGKIT